MSTDTTSATSHGTDRPLRSFHTPVRGHAFSVRPRSGDALDRTPLRLRREPDNPADPYAVAVWAEGGGTPWRVGYLERAVAARLAPRLDGSAAPVARFAGWWEEPEGRWQRPVVRVCDAASDDARPPAARGLRALPPFSSTRPVSGTRPGR